MMSEENNPLAENLEGLIINQKWKVIKKFEKQEDDTGGMFSVGYEVVDENGTAAFLKAFNFKKVFQNKEKMMEVLNSFTKQYNYEKEILEKCFNKRLKHIVNILDAEIIYKDGYFVPVPYLIFEMADKSLRSKINEINKKIDILWNLKCIHQVAVALQEIHNIDIAHLDLKPSNVLIFEEKMSKLTDFGRSSLKVSQDRPFYDMNGTIEGDMTYSPIERLYGNNDGDWYEIKVGTDFYLLGSFIFQMFTGFGMTVAITNNLDPQFNWRKWRGNYNEVYSYILESYTKVIEKFEEDLKKQVDKKTTQEIIKIVDEMCNPDKSKRGDPELIRRKQIKKYELHRYITRIDRIIKRLEIVL